MMLARRSKGRKRQLAVGVEDSLIVIGLHPAEVQDRDSAQEVILELRRLRQEAVCRPEESVLQRLCGSETGWKVEGARGSRTARDRGQAQG